MTSPRMLIAGFEHEGCRRRGVSGVPSAGRTGRAVVARANREHLLVQGRFS
jgi:hypothetical protein